VHIPYRTMILTDDMRQKALDVLETGSSYGGEETQRFEVELAERSRRRYGVVANSGTSILLLALEALGVGPGDEVLMAANAYIGVLAAVVKTGATPVFVEADPATWNIAPAATALANTFISPLPGWRLASDKDGSRKIHYMRLLTTLVTRVPPAPVASPGPVTSATSGGSTASRSCPAVRSRVSISAAPTAGRRESTRTRTGSSPGSAPRAPRGPPLQAPPGCGRAGPGTPNG